MSALRFVFASNSPQKAGPAGEETNVPKKVRPRPGEFLYDCLKTVKGMPLRFETSDAFYEWLKNLEDLHEIEFTQTKKKRNPKYTAGSLFWKERISYSCQRRRSGPGGTTDRGADKKGRRIKTIGCQSRIQVSLYPESTGVLGFYKNEHNHAVSDVDENLSFTSIPKGVKEDISSKIKAGASVGTILAEYQNKKSSKHGIAKRETAITTRYIRQMHEKWEDAMIGQCASPVGPEETLGAPHDMVPAPAKRRRLS